MIIGMIFSFNEDEKTDTVISFADLDHSGDRVADMKKYRKEVDKMLDLLPDAINEFMRDINREKKEHEEECAKIRKSILIW